MLDNPKAQSNEVHHLKVGAYTNHLVVLSEDRSVNHCDHCKLCGYYKRWVEGKYILGCAVFVDVLNPCAICSKTLQSDEIDILGALTSLLKTVSETDKLSPKPLEQWPTFAATQKKCTVENSRKVYQCQELVSYKQAVDYYKAHYAEYCTKIL